MNIEPNSVEASELVEQTFHFWYGDHEHIRSPFPSYIQAQLKELAVTKFFEWLSGLNEKAKDEINDEIIGERFEEIIFEIATTLVLTEDEKLTIMYPFLPRVGDKIYEDVENETGLSEVIGRMLVKEKDHSYFKIKLKKDENGALWETKFDLPV